MITDKVHACYGVLCWVDPSDRSALELLNRRCHPFQIAALKHGLRCWWGPTADDSGYTLLVGAFMGIWNGTADSPYQLSEIETTSVKARTVERLRSAGIEGRPTFHLTLADYAEQIEGIEAKSALAW